MFRDKRCDIERARISAFGIWTPQSRNIFFSDRITYYLPFLQEKVLCIVGPLSLHHHEQCEIANFILIKLMIKNNNDAKCKIQLMENQDHVR